MCSLHHWTISVSPTRLTLSLFASHRFFDGIDTNFLFSFFLGEVGVIWSVMRVQKHANVQNRDQHKKNPNDSLLTHSLAVCDGSTNSHNSTNRARVYWWTFDSRTDILHRRIKTNNFCVNWLDSTMHCNNHQSMSSTARALRFNFLASLPCARPKKSRFHCIN